MKRIYFALIILFCLVFTVRAQNNVGINDDNSSPKSSAMLDVFSTTKGLLIPRIALTASTTAAPVTAPEASLLIYNTASAGDVTPGYYYWDGTSKWVRLLASTDPEKSFNLVTKTADATLLKTENMVFASGNITLTFPVISSTDDGLEITVKNIGIYSDLITVTGSAGTTIDNVSIVTLTRWKARTFIASSGSWYFKEREVMKDNFLDVGAFASWNTIAGVIAFLNLHMDGPTVVQLGVGTFSIAATQTINLPYPVTFVGSSYGSTFINGIAGVTGTPLFDCLTECSFKMIVFTAFANAAGNDGIRFTGAGKYHEVKDCTFIGFNKGLVSTTNNDFWIFEDTFEDCTAAAIEIAAGPASGGKLEMANCDFTRCKIGINFLSGVSETISILSCNFYNTTSGTDIGINYIPTDFTSIISMFISNNAWNNQGTFTSGFDFSRSDSRDANVFLYANLGMENKNPYAKISVRNNASTTTVTTPGTYYKAVWTTSIIAEVSKWTIGSTSPTSGNRITYQPNNKGDAWAIITGNLSTNQAASIVTFAIVKNGNTGTPYGETNLYVSAKENGQPYQFSTVVYIPNMAKNDYLELFVTSNKNNDNIIFQDVQWYTDTH